MPVTSGWDRALAAWLCIAVAALALGVLWRLAVWLRTPSRRRVTLTPGPGSVAGVVLRMVRETLFFETLFRASPWTWLFGWLFHAGLALVLLSHLRYVTREWWSWVGWIAAYGHLASGAMLVGLAGLWARRLLVDRVRWISRPSDHLLLGLIAVIAVTGVVTKYLAPVDVVAVKGFVRGLLGDAGGPLPASPWLVWHVAGAGALLALFPFGKLMHGPGLWVNPTRARPHPVNGRAADG